MTPKDIMHFMEVVRSRWNFEDNEFGAIEKVISDPDCIAVLPSEIELDELQRTFDLQWKADQRAIKCWQEAHPGNDLVWPDRADMVVWLMEKWDESRSVQNLDK